MAAPQERWGNCQCDEIHQEAGFEERIAVHCYRRHIADDLCEHAEHLAISSQFSLVSLFQTLETRATVNLI
jgi:hypothetical protein